MLGTIAAVWLTRQGGGVVANRWPSVLVAAVSQSTETTSLWNLRRSTSLSTDAARQSDTDALTSSTPMPVAPAAPSASAMPPPARPYPSHPSKPGQILEFSHVIATNTAAAVTAPVTLTSRSDLHGHDADPGAGPGPGPGSEVVELMRLLRRARSPVDVRIALSSHREAVDHLALVAAMSRLAQLYTDAPSYARRDRQLARNLLSQMVDSLVVPEPPFYRRHLASCTARQLATCLHCISVVNETRGTQAWTALLDALCADQAAVLVRGSGLDVATIALALAKMKKANQRAWRAVARGAAAHAASMTPSEVAITVSALARAGAHEYGDAYDSLLAHAAADADAFSGRNLANTIWAAVRHMQALTSRGHRVELEGTRTRAAAAAAAAVAATCLVRRLPGRLRQCGPTELSRATWALARLGSREHRAWASLGSQLRYSAGALSPDELCLTAESLVLAWEGGFAPDTTTSGPPTTALPTTGVQPAPQDDDGRSEAVAGSSHANTGPLPAEPSNAHHSAGPDAGMEGACGREPDSAGASGSAGGPTVVDPAALTATLLEAASLRLGAFNPQHLARLLRVVVRAGGVRPPGEGDGERGQRGTSVLEGSTAAFVEKARAQLLRTPLKGFPRLWDITSLVTSLHTLSSQLASTDEATGKDPDEAEGTMDRQTRERSARKREQPVWRVSEADLFDRLAAAAAARAPTAAPAEVRVAAAAFAAAEHFNSALCTALASRVESLAASALASTGRSSQPWTQFDPQLPSSHYPPPDRQPRPSSLSGGGDDADDVEGLPFDEVHPGDLGPGGRDDVAVWHPGTLAEAAAGTVGELLGALEALARLQFHNDAALAATLPAVAATLPNLPPRSLVAAMAAYGASGAPPLGLMSALAGALLAKLSLQPESGPASNTTDREVSPSWDTSPAPQGSGTAVELGGLSTEQREAVRAACVQWQASLLYPASYGVATGAPGQEPEGGGSDGVSPGQVGELARPGAAADEGAGVDMDRCSVLLRLVSE